MACFVLKIACTEGKVLAVVDADVTLVDLRVACERGTPALADRLDDGTGIGVGAFGTGAGVVLRGEKALNNLRFSANAWTSIG